VHLQCRVAVVAPVVVAELPFIDPWSTIKRGWNIAKTSRIPQSRSIELSENSPKNKP